MKGTFKYRFLVFQVLLALLLPVLIGCDNLSNKVNEYLNAGTNLGYKSCFEQNKDVGLKEGVIKKLCLEKHHRSISPKITGKAGYDYEYGCKFKGWITNKSSDTIITSFEVNLKHIDNKDKTGKILNETLSVKDKWIEPYQNDDFTVYDLKFKPEEDQSKGKFYSWSFNNVKGLKVKLK